MGQRTERKEGTQRILYLDALRMVSVFAVMVLHLAATGYTAAAPKSYQRVICLIYNSITRFAVPVFVMISGALHLDPQREISMEYLLKKLGKLMTTFAAWAFVYALAESLEEHVIFTSGYFLSVMQKTITGHYHMWYVYMIEGLYLAIPFLRPIVSDRKLLRMFLLLVFLLNHAAQLLCHIPGWEGVFGSVLNRAELGIFTGYTGYYCLGHYLHSSEFTKKQVSTFSLLSILVLVISAIGCILLGKPNAVFSEKMPHVFLYSISVFLLFKSNAERLEEFKTAIGKIAPCTFGMYLVHPMFNFLLRKAGLYALTFDPLFCIPLCSVLVCTCSLAVIFLMRKIPLTKRFA